ncbi:MAG: 3-dehydroquinate synthase [Clostridia bacterium]|nr:3-dehydroquinate synthase [Clostridia bacterium]
MRIPVKTSSGTYDIVLERGALQRAGEYLNLDRRVLVVTDDGVPAEYARTVAMACTRGKVLTLPQGERSKQLDTYRLILEALVEHDFTRTDCIVAVGGGVIGDMAGFAAATFMRGIDFYNIPTTVLSQVDSSIGGKTAVDFMGFKNLVGAFYPPKGVIIDPDTLHTLPARQIANGLAESVKMALTSDDELFSLLEAADGVTDELLDVVIERSLRIKKQVVEADEHEGGLRKVLNFGHTLAHAVESLYGLDTYYHGECVALGMLPMCDEAVRRRLLPVLTKLGLPTALVGKADDLIAACRHDKKAAGDTITVVYVPQVGSFTFKTLPFEKLEQQIRQVAQA